MRRHVYIHTYIHTYSIYMYVCVCGYECVSVQQGLPASTIYQFVHARMHTHIYTYICVCVCVCVQQGLSCLLMAAQQGHLEVVKYLCENGGDELLVWRDQVSMCMYVFHCVYVFECVYVSVYVHPCAYGKRCGCLSCIIW